MFYADSLKPGDVVMETEVTSQVLHMSDPTSNSTHKNIVDWFLGVVGFKPESNEVPSEPSPSPPNVNCPKCSKKVYYYYYYYYYFDFFSTLNS